MAPLSIMKIQFMMIRASSAMSDYTHMLDN